MENELLNSIEFKLKSIQEGTIYSTGDLGSYLKSNALGDFSIIVEPSSTQADGYLKDPYFKAYNNTNKKGKCARISMKTGEEIIHFKGKDRLKLTTKQLNFLHDMFEDMHQFNPKYSKDALYNKFYEQLENKESGSGKEIERYELPDRFISKEEAYKNKRESNKNKKKK